MSGNPNQRREPRMPMVDSFMLIGGRRLELRNWSYSGFFAGPIEGELNLGREFDFTLELRSELGNAEVKGRGKLVRSDSAGIAGTWTLEKPSQQAAMLLRYFLAYPDPSVLED